jgi:hypothetical protein
VLKRRVAIIFEYATPGLSFQYRRSSQSGDPIRVDCSREHIVSSTEGSLRRLRTDHLDTLLFATMLALGNVTKYSGTKAPSCATCSSTASSWQRLWVYWCICRRTLRRSLRWRFIEPARDHTTGPSTSVAVTGGIRIVLKGLKDPPKSPPQSSPPP